jgi:hypothetical protein
MMDPTFSIIPSLQREESIFVRLISRMTEVDSIFALQSWRLEKFVLFGDWSWNYCGRRSYMYGLKRSRHECDKK